ncbi:MAG: glycoside hydrolase 43 family protein [Bacteroidaceae bacterium]|nr:glycoside hydrolase 43 family protein [Bacteroidaceae bacterium]
MKKTLSLFVLLSCVFAVNAQYKSQVWCPDNGDGTFTNPVVNADYSDPDVCVGASGEDFYMTASSFCHVPGLPILHSKDLVNWEIVNHAITELPPTDRYNRPQHGNGVWAPCIRYNHHNKYYYIYWGDPDLGVFMTRAQNPLGKWSEPKCIIEGKGMIDTSPLWDDDGRCYLVNGWANSRCQFNSVLTVREMDSEGLSAISNPVIVFDGNGTPHRTAEGPKFYKRDGWYWIMCPAGGVPTGHQLAMRAKNPYGPYETKVVLATGNTEVNGPHQGGWVHLQSGEDWFLHFQDKEAYGRVVWLEPVKWVDNWPVMGEKLQPNKQHKKSDPNLPVLDKYCGQPVLKYKKPNVGKNYPINNPVENDEFDSIKLGKQWQWNANYDQTFGMPTPNGYFRLFCHRQSEGYKNLWEAGNLLLQKTPADNFTATAKLTVTAKDEGQYGGVICFGMDYSSLVLRRVGEEFQLQQISCKAADKGKPETITVLATFPPTAADKVDYQPSIHCTLYMQMKVEYLGGKTAEGENKHEAKVTFAYSKDGKKFTPCGEPHTMRQGKWVGSKVGFCAAEPAGKKVRGWADIDWFRITK